MSLKSRLERAGLRVCTDGKFTTPANPQASIGELTVRVPFGFRRALRDRAKQLNLTMSALVQLELQPPRLVGLPARLGRIVHCSRIGQSPRTCALPIYTGHDATIVELSVKIPRDLHKRLKLWAQLERLTLRALLMRELGTPR